MAKLIKSDMLYLSEDETIHFDADARRWGNGATGAPCAGRYPLSVGIDESGHVPSSRNRKLEVGTVPGARERHQVEGRQLVVQRIPVLDREHDVVIAAHMQHRNVRGLERVKHGFDREGGVPRPIAKLGAGPLPWHLGADVGFARGEPLCGLLAFAKKDARESASNNASAASLASTKT
ncbi:hypothetical protein [Cupriavidus sp. RAF20_2]|uniref:hypothetical protein n=1 Tax=Cupriavidus sp. RAF20_2 TaxID=3233053 RepID=UPI003F9166DC